MYLKSHSYGEYVFDWAWADAYERARLRYYPKLVAAVPFTPATGARLLAGPENDVITSYSIHYTKLYDRCGAWYTSHHS